MKATDSKFWLVDANEIARMQRVNTSEWQVIEVINDRFFVVTGASVLYQVQRAGYTGLNIVGLGYTDIEAIQHLNSIFEVENTWYWLKK